MTSRPIGDDQRQAQPRPSGVEGSRVAPIVGVVLGVPMMAFGVWGMVHDGARTHPFELGRWIVGSAVVHDLVGLPLLLGISLVATRPLPSWARAPVRAGLGVSAVLALVAWPEIAGYGEDTTIASLLPRNELAGLLAYLAIVWAVVAAALVVRGATRRPQPGDG